MKRVTFTASYPPALAHPMQRALGRVDGVSQAELLMWGPTETVTALFWYDGPAAAVEELLSAVESVETTHLIAGTDSDDGDDGDDSDGGDDSDDGGTYAFVAQRTYELADAVLELVADAQLIFLPPVTFFEDQTVRFEAVGESAALSEFYAGLSTVLDTSIESVHEFSRRPSTARLTDRQREALAAAVEVGYYAVPRIGETEAIAAELDCEPSTAGELLRKAEAAVITDYLD